VDHQPPSHPTKPQEAVPGEQCPAGAKIPLLKYLACYMTGGPISNGRILGDENDHVTF